MPSLKAAALAVALALAVPIGGAQAQTQNELQTMRTFLEIKTESKEKRGETVMDIESSIGDYKEVGGLIFRCRKFRRSMKNGVKKRVLRRCSRRSFKRARAWLSVTLPTSCWETL